MNNESRKQELVSELIRVWAHRGQAARDVEEDDKKITRLEHRLDELARLEQAEKEKEKTGVRHDDPNALPSPS